MKVEIANPKTMVVVAEQTKTFNSLTIRRMVDFPGQKKVIVHIEEANEPVVLWEGAAYDAIGEWTNADVIAKLNELYAA
jgi:hypothetical protein